MPASARHALPILRRLALGAALGAVLPLGVAHAQTFTLDFSGLGLANNAVIPDSYGDVPGLLDVGFVHRTTWGNATITESLARYYGANYNDLTGVAYTQAGPGVGELRLANLQPGQAIWFEAADLGSWPNVTSTVALRVYDFGWNLLYSATGGTVGATTHASFAGGPTVAGTAGLYIQWSRLDAQSNPIDAYDTGIDNVRFTIAPAVSTVPEPATLALLGTGLLALGGVARRRRSA